MASQADTDFADIYDLDSGFFGTDIKIQRGPFVGETVTGIVDVVENKIAEGMPNTGTSVVSRNYEIDAVDYKVNGQQVEPRSGDRIRETINGVACIFELMKVGKDLPAFERLDSDGVRWLVRTKQVSNG